MRNVRLFIVICLTLSLAGVSIAQPAQTDSSRKIDGFSGLGCEDMMGRLDSYAITLQSEPDAQAYIIVYGGQQGQRGEAQMWASRAKYYLTGNRMIDAKRIVTLDGGYREHPAMELWLSQKGSPLPQASPTIQLKDVKFKKGRIKKSQYRCDI